MTTDALSQRHRQRMQRKKAVVDEAIQKADKEQGLLLVLTGNGKGKSSSAFGMLARALGYGMRVGVAQFIKGRSDTGEESFFGQHPRVSWHVLGEGFTWDTQNLQKDRETAQQGGSVVQPMLRDKDFDMVILDELTYPLNYGWLDTDSVLSDLKNRPLMQHVIVTGRAASDSLCEVADTVSDIKDVKHAFQSGVQAQKGIDL